MEKTAFNEIQAAKKFLIEARKLLKLEQKKIIPDIRFVENANILSAHSRMNLLSSQKQLFFRYTQTRKTLTNYIISLNDVEYDLSNEIVGKSTKRLLNIIVQDVPSILTLSPCEISKPLHSAIEALKVVQLAL